MECELKDITVHYKSIGEGIPILMLHGWSLSHRQMLNVMEPLFAQRDRWKRIYPDLPGHGRTPAREWITNQDGILDVVLDFIDKVIPGRRFVVAGASAGAYLARGVAYRKGGMLDGVLLVVPLIVAPDAERKVPARTILVKDPELLATLPPEEAQEFDDLAVVQTREMVEALRVFLAANEIGDEGFQAGIREDPRKYAFSFDVDALPEPCAAPTLIIAGRQDSMVGYSQAWEILENYPRATFAVLDRAGHCLEFEQGEVFGVLVREWLNRVEEYAAGQT
jgi:pimeloyl-ACP methyl ester carboxylesterase